MTMAAVAAAAATDDEKCCCICFEDLNIAEKKQLRCGHEIHELCYNGLLNHNIKTCPTCRSSMFEEWRVQIHCITCGEDNYAIYDELAIRCPVCDSYNTTYSDDASPLTCWNIFFNIIQCFEFIC